jgi:epoxyqueuosine reductase
MSAEARFQSRGDRAVPALLPLLEHTEESFRTEFNGSPIQRARRDGFVRNVVVALGNVGGAESVDPLFRRLRTDPSAIVRGHAAWALGRVATRLGDEPLTRRIMQLLMSVDDQEASVREELNSTITDLRGSKVQPEP